MVSIAHSRPSVVVTRGYPDGGTRPLLEADLDVDQLQPEERMSRALLLEKVGGVQAILASVTERIDQEVLDAAPALRVVAEFGVGYDNIDVDACTRRGVIVCNTPGVLA